MTTREESISCCSFGTYLVEDPNVIESALSAGYRRFDCAPIYGNERLIGEVLTKFYSRNSIQRSDVQLVTKVWMDAMEKGKVKESVLQSIKDLNNLNDDNDDNNSYVDIVMLHWPLEKEVNRNSIRQIFELIKEKKVKYLGLSNFWPNHYEDIKDLLDQLQIKPVINQLEMNVLTFDTETIEYFRKEGIKVRNMASEQPQQQHNQF